MPSKIYYEIEETIPCKVLYGDPNVEVHTLTCEKHYLRTMWAFKSFFNRCGQAIRPSFVFHDDGTLTEETKEKFLHHFKNLRIVSPKEAQEAANEKLNTGHLDCLRDHRNSGLMMRKLLDPVLVTDKPYVMWLDTDFIWFNKSPMVNECIDKQIPFYVGGYGGGECYCYDTATLRVDLQLDPAWNFNAGLIGYPTDREFFDLDVLNKWLSILIEQRDLLEGNLNWWVAEQTLNAMLFRRDQRSIRIPHAGQFDWDPMEHRMYTDTGSYRDIDHKTACCHYIGDSGYAEIFTQGAKYLIDNFYLSDWKKSPIEDFDLEEPAKVKEEIPARDYSKVNFILRPECQERIKEVIGDREDFWVQESLNVESELVPGCYRYRLYIYSNLFEGTPEGNNLTTEDKVMLTKIFRGMQDCHKLNWVREYLYEIDSDKIIAFQNFLIKIIMGTKNFEELKVALYGLNMIRSKEFIIDDYMVKCIPALSRYVEEK